MPYTLLAADGRLFAGFADGQLWNSTDGGELWRACPLRGDTPVALLALGYASD
jgi:hypothetical protein